MIDKMANGPNAIDGARHLHHNVLMNFSEGCPFLNHPLKIGRNDFCAHVAVHHFTNGRVMRTNCCFAFDAFLRHEGRICGHTIQNAQGLGLFNGGQVRRVDEKFHAAKIGKLPRPATPSTCAPFEHGNERKCTMFGAGKFGL